MKRLLTLGILTAALLALAPASVALAATTPSTTHASMHTDVSGGAVGSVSGVVAISTFGENCTGAVIAPRVVLTAAHCLDDVLDKGTIRVLLDHTHQNLGVSAYYIAPGFDATTHTNDAAVLILKSASKEPALALTHTEPTAGTDAMITGYGQLTYTSAVTTIGYHADTTIQSFTACQTSWAQLGATVPNSDICAQNASTTVTRGDSGGPLLVKSSTGNWTVAGINDLVVTTNGAYNDAIPQAFQRIDTIHPWIQQMITQFG